MNLSPLEAGVVVNQFQKRSMLPWILAFSVVVLVAGVLAALYFFHRCSHAAQLPSTIRRVEVDMRFVRIGPGTFLMGDPRNASTEDDEHPHTVTLTRPFPIGVCTATSGSGVPMRSVLTPTAPGPSPTPTGPSDLFPQRRVTRGGDWYNLPTVARCSTAATGRPTSPGRTSGFAWSRRCRSASGLNATQ